MEPTFHGPKCKLSLLLIHDWRSSGKATVQTDLPAQPATEPKILPQNALGYFLICESIRKVNFPGEG